MIPVVWTETASGVTGCDLLLLRSCWDYHLQPEAFLKWVTAAAASAHVINPVEIVRWNIDKRYLQEIKSAGYGVPKTVLLAKGESVDLAELMSRQRLGTIVVKPAISLSAYETYLVRGEDAEKFSAKLNRLLQERDMLVQEFVPEIATGGEWSLIFLGGEFSHAVKKFPKTGDFRVQHEYGGSAERATPSESMRSMARDVLRRFAPQALYCRADVVPRAQGLALMELELIDPVLHFELAAEGAKLFAELLCRDER